MWPAASSQQESYQAFGCGINYNVSHDPGVEAANFLVEHPEVKAIALGCGKFVEESAFSFCNHSEEMSIWHSKAMIINIMPGSCDVIVEKIKRLKSKT